MIYKQPLWIELNINKFWHPTISKFGAWIKTLLEIPQILESDVPAEKKNLLKTQWLYLNLIL